MLNPSSKKCRIAATALLLAAQPLLAAPSTFTAPDAGAVLSTLSHGHPRLLAGQAEFARLRSAVSENETLKTWYGKVRQSGEKLLSQAASKYEIPDGLRLLATSRQVRDRVTTLSLLYRLTDDRRYADRAWKELSAAAAFPDWNPRHFLDTAEMTAAFAIGYDWLNDFWTPEQRTVLREAIVAKGLNAALAIYRKGGWWTVAHHNWNQVCNGGIGLGALVLGDEEPSLCGEILHDAIQSLPLAMTEFGPDGAWGEGPGYWSYATQYNVLFLAALDSALGTDFGLSKIPGFSLTGGFPINFTGPLGKTFNYADVGKDGKFGGAVQLFWLASKFKEPSYAALQMGYANASPDAMDLLWGAEWAQKRPQMGVYPLNRYFRGPEVATLRSAWNDPNALFVGFKAGDNKTNHSHLDLGSFVLDALGCRWAVDLGSDNYNMPGYFGKQRWDYYRLRAEAHNTLLINPGAGPDQNPKAVCSIVRFQEQPAFAIADLDEAYKPQATRVERGIRMTGANEVLVQDEVATPAPAEVWWFFHTPAEVEIAKDGGSAILKQGAKRLRVSMAANAPARFEVRAPEPLPSSPHPAKQGDNKGVRVLALHFSGVKDLRLAVRLTAGQTTAQQPVAPLKEWR